MPSLTRLLTLLPPSNPPSPTPEDIFASAPGLIFTDDLQTNHGSPQSTLLYHSARFERDIKLATADPDEEEDRKLFAHYLWNAGVKLAELLGTEGWEVKGEWVLELGAGVGLSGIVASLAGAQHVTMSDYPSPILLSVLRQNCLVNLPTQDGHDVEGHVWGELDNPFAHANAGSYTRVLAADTLWLEGSHEPLLESMLHFLSPTPHARAYVIAGFHTGRAKLASFFALAQQMGLVPGRGTKKMM